MQLRRLFCIALICCGIHATTVRAAADDAPAKVTYQDHVRPIFQQHCFACHSQDDRNSDLALDNYNDVMVGGAGGEIVSGGDVDGSRLWLLITHQDAPEMPPGGDKLPQDQLDLIQAWIAGGLLKDKGSKPKKSKLADVGGFQPTADNRPQGEPAMPEGLFREPLLYSPRAGAVGAAALSPWAPLAAVAGLRQVSLYHTESGALLGVLPYPEGMPRSIRFSRNGSLLVVGGGWPAQLGNAALYDVKTGARIATVGEETDEVLTADISPDHSLIALGGPKKVVRVFRTADGSLAYEIRKHTEWITAVQFSPDGSLLVTADRGGGLYLWDGPTGNERAELRGHGEHVTSVSWRADSKALASASEDDTVRLWQTDGKQIKSWGAHGGGVLSIDFAADGMLASAGRDRRLKLWTVDGKPVKDLAGLDDAALVARLSHDSTLALAADWSGRVQLFDIDTGEPRSALPANPPTLQMRVAEAAVRLENAARARDEADQQLQQLTAQLTESQAVVGAFQQERENAAAKANQRNQQRVEAAAEAAHWTEAWRAAVDAAANTVSDLTSKRNQLNEARAKLQLLQAAAAVDAGEAEGAAAQEVQQQERVLAQIAEQVGLLGQQAANAEQAAADAQHQAQTAQQRAETAAEEYSDAARELAELEAQSEQLPSVAALERRLVALTNAHDATEQEHEEALAHWNAASAEQAAFVSASEALASQLAARMSELHAMESTASKAQQEHEQLLAKLAERKRAADELAAQIERLQDQLRTKRADQRAVRAVVQEHADQLSQLQASLAKAAKAAELADARIQQFQQAHRVRLQYRENVEGSEPSAKAADNTR